ncbi:MAG: dienelactone hydrolase family protein [Candidatus Eremiobacteraeota bacterium]|nr:dienelactone hydrolase family protein [Candidatus Eremiobacteraeota bacterium]
MTAAARTEFVTVPVSDGTAMNAYVARPGDDAKSAPAVVVFQEAYGVNDYICDVTKRFAALGMVAIAPELFHRSAPSGFTANYGDMEAVREHITKMTREGLEADIDATFSWLADDGGVDPEEMAAVGFCMGGRVAYVANSRTRLRAAISFYGGGIAPDLLPLASAQRGPILMFWGGLDQHIAPEQYRAVADALTEANATHEQVVFSQADHGFFCDQRASYNPIASRQAWAMLKEFLASYGALP